MNSTFRPWIFRLAFAGIIGSAIVFSGFGTAFAQKGDKKGSEAQDEKAQELAKLKPIFTGQLIDLYFTPDELAKSEPRMKDAKFTDVVFVTGKPLLQMEKSGDTWLVDPETIFIYRLHKK